MLYKFFKIFINTFLSLFNLRLNKITLSNDFYYYIVRTLIYFKIDLVLDVGANTGQFSEKIIKLGYKKKIISFEPMSEAHRELSLKSKKIKNWQIYDRVGVGKQKSIKTLNISKNSVSSSILEISKNKLNQEPNAKFIKKEKINLISLNDLLKKKIYKKKRIFLKIDTQGYEKQIIIGASKVLNRIHCIMLEASITPLYKGEVNYLNIIEFMKKKGFYVWAIERGFSNKKIGKVNQIDVIFINKNV